RSRDAHARRARAGSEPTGSPAHALTEVIGLPGGIEIRASEGPDAPRSLVIGTRALVHRDDGTPVPDVGTGPSAELPPGLWTLTTEEEGRGQRQRPDADAGFHRLSTEKTMTMRRRNPPTRTRIAASGTSRRPGRASATRPMARSRSQTPPSAAPGARCSTFVGRFGVRWSWKVAAPFGQSVPSLWGLRGSPSMFTIRPLMVWTSVAQPTEQ